MFKNAYGTMYYVTDMKKAVEFYKSKFGLRPTHESDGWTEISVGGHNICLHAARAGEPKREGGVLIFNFEGVKELHKQMSNDGLKVTGLHEVRPGHWTFHTYDVDGNEFSVYGPG